MDNWGHTKPFTSEVTLANDGDWHILLSACFHCNVEFHLWCNIGETHLLSRDPTVMSCWGQRGDISVTRQSYASSPLAMVKWGHYFIITKYVCSRIVHFARNFCWLTKSASFIFILPDRNISRNWKVGLILWKKTSSFKLGALNYEIGGGGFRAKRGWLGGNHWQVLHFTSQSYPLAKSISWLRPK